MGRAFTNIRLNGNTEEAFKFYKSVFGTDYSAPVLHWDDMGEFYSCPLTEDEKKLVLHIELPILGGMVLAGHDAAEGQDVRQGNNISITLELDSQAEAEFLLEALSEGGKIEVPISYSRVGQYGGYIVDRYGVHWHLTGPMRSNRTGLPNQAL